MSAPCDDEPGAPATAVAELSGADPQPPVCQQRIGYEQERSSSRARAILPPVRSRRVHRSFSWPRSGDTKGCEGIGPTFSEPLTTRTWTHSSNGLPSCANSSAPAEGSASEASADSRRSRSARFVAQWGERGVSSVRAARSTRTPSLLAMISRCCRPTCSMVARSHTNSACKKAAAP